MRQTTVHLYDIKELKKDARDKAIEYLRTHEYFGVDSRAIEAAFVTVLNEYGLPTDNIEFSLGWCQGDGVAFYGDIDLKKLLKRTGQYDRWAYLLRRYDLSATSTRNSFGNHYSHYNTMDVYLERESEYLQQRDRAEGKELWDHVKETVVMVSKKLEQRGYKMIEEHQSEEHIIASAEANEMEFRKDGRLWGG
jgi:hypothetical protein